MALFVKLRVKFFYNIIYYLQINDLSKQTKQILEIILYFYINLLTNIAFWPEVLPKIQFLLNNTLLFIIYKTPSKITYSFLPRR